MRLHIATTFRLPPISKSATQAVPFDRLSAGFERLRAGAQCLAAMLCLAAGASAQLTDVTQTPNTANAGIQKSLPQEIGMGRGGVLTPDSSLFLIRRDPFRSIARGRQIFQRKFTAGQGLGPRTGDGQGAIELDGSIGAGLSDSCAACHGRPFGSAGTGGNVHTRPESRDAPHLFGLGLVEMLADEITGELRGLRTQAIASALQQGIPVSLPLTAKGISYGTISALGDGSLDTSAVVGVNADLRVRPFFADGRTISIREFVAGAFNAEMGLEAFDPDLVAAAAHQDVTTPAGMRLSGSIDTIDASVASSELDDPDGDGVRDEVPASLLDATEFYLLNYFRPGQGRTSAQSSAGLGVFQSIGCANCHIRTLVIEHDRRVADVDTRFDELRSNRVFNSLYALATPRFSSFDDGSGMPPIKAALNSQFEVRGIFADFRRHDLGAAFHERNFDGSVTTLFMTEPLWGVASTAPYGHDGRSQTLEDVILRHGGEAQASRDAFVSLNAKRRDQLLAMLGTLTLFSPPDTASNLDPGDTANPLYPFRAHGSIDLSVLFNFPLDKE